MRRQTAFAERAILLSVAVVFFLIMAAGTPTAQAAQPRDKTHRLEKEFVKTQDSAKPHTWWHWMNGNVTAEGITADLEAMEEIGLGGLQAFHVTDRIPAGPVDYMSEEWRELMTHTVREADRLGLKVCLHNCAGWSSSGGPWITPEHSMKQVVWTTTQVEGPTDFSGTLPRPEAKLDFYRDITVLAFPTPASERDGGQGFRLKHWKVKAGYKRQITEESKTYYSMWDWRSRGDAQPDKVDAAEVIPRGRIIDLADRTDTDGKLDWNVPEGHWTIMRLGYTTTGVENHPAPPEGLGLECDKLSAGAAELNWNNMI